MSDYTPRRIAMLGMSTFADMTFISGELAKHPNLFPKEVYTTCGELSAEFSKGISTQPNDVFWLTQITKLEFIQSEVLKVQKRRHDPINEDAVRTLSHLIMLCRYQVEAT